MGMIKICPNKSCGHHNLLSDFECEKCGMELMSVNPVDEDSITVDEPNQSTSNNAPTSHAVRVCEECGHVNPVNIGVCESCGEDISGVIPTVQEENESDECHFVLSSLDGVYAYEILSEKIIIGRENEMKDYLADKPFTSRRQAEINISEGKLYIRHLSDKPSTFINNQQILDGDLHELFDGDEIGLGGFNNNGDRTDKAAFFLVRIGSCNV